MATGTVGELDEESKRKDERDEARRELASAMARYAKAELACSGSGRNHAALLDGRLRTAALEVARLGLEHLWEAARGRHGDGDLARAWAKKLCGMLGAGRLGDVLDDLRQRGGDSEECRRTAAYLAARRDRMRYGEYRADGLPIGSGIIEAGCKNVVGRRMKCTGMRWTVAGANPVLWLRCARLGDWLDTCWDDRIARLAA